MRYFKQKTNLLAITLTFTISLASSLLISSCDNNEKAENCAPSNAKISGDSIVYLYGNDNKLSEIQYRSKNFVHERDLVIYTNGKLTKLSKTYQYPNAPGFEGESYVISYGSNGLPNFVIHYPSPGSSNPDTITYSHDDKKRVLRREIISRKTVVRSTRYEYNTANNVTKIYYINSPGTPEAVGSEFLTYDTHKRFFAGSSELEMIEVYIYGFQPSVNNVVSFKFYGSLGSSPGPAQDANYVIAYDDKGNVKSMSSNYYFPDLLFSKMIYACH